MVQKVQVQQVHQVLVVLVGQGPRVNINNNNNSTREQRERVSGGRGRTTIVLTPKVLGACLFTTLAPSNQIMKIIHMYMYMYFISPPLTIIINLLLLL